MTRIIEVPFEKWAPELRESVHEDSLSPLEKKARSMMANAPHMAMANAAFMGTAMQGRKLALLKGESGTLPGPDAAFEQRERAEAVRAALATLGDKDREALLLKAEGFSYDEIAVALGLARGAVGTTLARARRKLVEAFREQGRVSHVAR